MEMKVDGLDDILRKLTQLNVNEELEGRALTKAGKVTQGAVLKEASIDDRNPPDSASLHKNIKLSRPKNGEVTVHTGGAYHAHLIEFGRSGGSVVTKKGRKVTWGPTAPNPFFSRGFEQSAEKAKQAMIEELQKELKL